jgi:hypothetical protein
MTEVTQARPLEPCRIEPQYIQAGMTYWANLNSGIIQKLALLLAIQSSACVGGYTLRGSVAGILVILLCYGLSVLLVVSIHSDIRVRDILIGQLNFLTKEALAPYLAHRDLPADLKPEFIFFDPRENDRQIFVRHFGASVGMQFFLPLFDGMLLIIFQFPKVFELFLGPASIPIFPKLTG